MFKPDRAWIAEVGLKVEDTLLEPDGEGRLKLLVHNPSGETKKLPNNSVVGRIELYGGDPSNGGSGSLEGTNSNPDVTTSIQMVTGEKGSLGALGDSEIRQRKEKLEDLMDVSKESLSEDDIQQIRTCVAEAHHVFALEKNELGEVTVV